MRKHNIKSLSVLGCVSQIRDRRDVTVNIKYCCFARQNAQFIGIFRSYSCCSVARVHFSWGLKIIFRSHQLNKNC